MIISTLTSLMIAIALWCGQPTPPVQIGTDIIVTRSPQGVQECRDRLIDCLSKAKDNKKCFTEERIR